MLSLASEENERERGAVHPLRKEVEKEQLLTAFLNEQTTVLPARAFIPSHHKERAISFKARVTVGE